MKIVTALLTVGALNLSIGVQPANAEYDQFQLDVDVGFNFEWQSNDYVGNSHISWNHGSPIDLFNSSLVNDYLGSGTAFSNVDYFTAGLPGGVANSFGYGIDTGFVNTFAVLHDWN